MKIIPWNCRGGWGTSTVCHTCHLLYSTNHSITFISKTKPHSLPPPLNPNKANFTHHYVVSSNGRSGGLWLLWYDLISLHICPLFPTLLLLKSRFLKKQNGCWSAFRVVRPTLVRKKFGTLYTQASSFLSPWLCIGDFNTIQSSQDRFGGSPVTFSSTKDFNEFIAQTHLLNLGYCGAVYTWSNKRQHTFNIEERLDKTFATINWILHYPKAVVHHLPAIGSYHRPILPQTDRLIPSTRNNSVLKPFGH